MRQLLAGQSESTEFAYAWSMFAQIESQKIIFFINLILIIYCYLIMINLNENYFSKHCKAKVVVIRKCKHMD